MNPQTSRAAGQGPGAAAPTIGAELGLAGLRSKPRAKFPCLIFYVEQPNHIEIWRVLHMRRDSPASLAMSAREA